MRTLRITLWVASAVIAVALAAFAWLGTSNQSVRNVIFADFGAPIDMKTPDGGRLTSADLKGKPFAIFFGFTYCPDVCPTTLLELTNTIKQLGPDADKMRFLFVSVDPERDTAELMKTYLSNFDPHITGLLGTPGEIAKLAKGYRAVYEKVPTKDGYTINHTATTYLMDRHGHLFGTLAYQEDPTTRLAKLKRLIASN